MKRIVSNILFVIGLVASHMAVGQESIDLTISEALNIAKEKNRRIAISKAEVELSNAVYRETNTVFLPNIGVSHSAVNTNDPLNVFGIKLKQNIVTDQDFNSDILNDPESISNFNTRIHIEQPLINLDGYHNRKVVNSLQEATRNQSQRIEHQVLYQVKANYFQLVLLYEQLNVIQKAIHTAKEHQILAEHYREQGLLKDAELLEVNIQVLDLQNQLIQTRNSIAQANNSLIIKLGLSQEAIVNPSDKLNYIPLPEQSAGELTVSESRTDIKAEKLKVVAAEKSIAAARSKFIPNLNAFGAYEWNDASFFGTSASNYTLGARLSWQLFDGSRQLAGIQKAKANLNMTELALEYYMEQNNLELNNAWKDLYLNHDMVELKNESKTQASEVYRIRKDRFELGMERSVDLLDAETKLAQKELEYLSAIFNYYMSYFKLELLLEKTFI